MNDELDRRDFLKVVPAAIATATAACSVAAPEKGAEPAPATAVTAADATPPPTKRLETFDFDGVRLLPSRWQQQVDAGRAYYLAIPDDDILHGCRKEAGLPAPGTPLGGWCGVNSNSVFGQWLSGMSRMKLCAVE